MTRYIKLIAVMMSVALTTTSCGDFLNEYSQDMVVAKTVYHLDEVLLGNGYIKSTIVESGPTIGNVAGFSMSWTMMSTPAVSGRRRARPGVTVCRTSSDVMPGSLESAATIMRQISAVTAIRGITCIHVSMWPISYLTR